MKKSFISFVRSALVAAIIATAPAQSFAMDQAAPAQSIWQKAKNFVNNNKKALWCTAAATTIIATKLAYDYLNYTEPKYEVALFNPGHRMECPSYQQKHFDCLQLFKSLNALIENESTHNDYGSPFDRFFDVKNLCNQFLLKDTYFKHVELFTGFTKPGEYYLRGGESQ